MSAVTRDQFQRAWRALRLMTDPLRLDIPTLRLAQAMSVNHLALLFARHTLAMRRQSDLLTLSRDLRNCMRRAPRVRLAA